MKQLLIQAQHFMFIIRNLFLCRHLDNDSVCLFNKPTSSNRPIATFSARYKSHFCELTYKALLLFLHATLN